MTTRELLKAVLTTALLVVRAKVEAQMADGSVKACKPVTSKMKLKL